MHISNDITVSFRCLHWRPFKKCVCNTVWFMSFNLIRTQSDFTRSFLLIRTVKMVLMLKSWFPNSENTNELISEHHIKACWFYIENTQIIVLLLAHSSSYGVLLDGGYFINVTFHVHWQSTVFFLFCYYYSLATILKILLLDHG